MLDYLQFVLAPQMITGLSLGVAVVLVALGLTIIFGLLDVINMSHGEFYAVGAYLALSLGALGVNFWLLLVLVPALMIPIGFAVERGLIQRVFNSPDRHVSTLLLTFGLGIVLEDVLSLIYGANTQRPPTPIRGAVEIFGIMLPNYRLFLILFGLLIVAAVALVVYKTRLGAMVRAAAYDRNMAASLGVPVKTVFAGAFAFGVALAGLAGVLLAPIYSVFPTMGRDFILLAFTVVIVGGIGSVAGVVVAGLALTQVQAIISLYISPVGSAPIVFASMVVLMVVPSFWAAMGATLACALLAGLIGGFVANRVRGVYFALITFGMAQVAAKVVYNTRALGASDGLIGVPVIEINLGIVSISSASPAAFFVFVLAFMLILYAVAAYLLDTPFGRLLIALRANEHRIPFLGYRAGAARL